MSLTIGITNPQGIILAADSRQTYINNLNQNRVGSDTATKIIPLSPTVAVTVAGNLYFDIPSPTNPYPKSVLEYITEYSYTLVGNETVQAIANDLHTFLAARYKLEEKLDQAKQALTTQIKQQGATIIPGSMTAEEDGRILTALITAKDGQQGRVVAPMNGLSLIVAGYDKLGTRDPKQHLFLINIPGKVDHRRRPGDQDQYGAVWQGQGDAVTRLLRGFDDRIGMLPFMQIAGQNMNPEQVNQQLGGLQYMVAWQAMTLQDAIEMSKLLIKTSIAIQKFSSGPVAQPLDIQGVGGPVDVAIIDPIEGFGWFQNKEIKVIRPEFNKAVPKPAQRRQQHKGKASKV